MAVWGATDDDFPPIGARLTSGAAPLTFAQQWWWNLYHAWGAANPSQRAMTIALRITGRLDLQAMEKSLAEVDRRHEALRTRITCVDGLPLQVVDPEGDLDLHVIKVDDDEEARRLVESFLALKVELSAGPLFAVRLIRIGPEHHVLALSLHHLVGDGFSYDLLLREVWTAYSHYTRGLHPSLPRVAVQLADYAVWQEQTSLLWSQRHEGYWQEQLFTAPPLCFPEPAPGSEDHSACATLQLEPTTVQALRAKSRTERTTLSMLVLTLYAAAYLRWQESDDFVLVLVANGRHLSELENTIGFLAAPLYLRIRLTPEDTFKTLLSRIVDDYYAAQKHWDQGRLSASFPGLEFKRGACFNWKTRPGDESASGGSDWQATLTLVPFAFEPPKFDMDPNGVSSTSPAAALDPVLSRWQPQVHFTDAVDHLLGLIWYRGDLYSASSIQNLTAAFHAFTRTFLDEPDSRIAALNQYLTPC